MPRYRPKYYEPKLAQRKACVSRGVTRGGNPPRAAVEDKVFPPLWSHYTYPTIEEVFGWGPIELTAPDERERKVSTKTVLNRSERIRKNPRKPSWGGNHGTEYSLPYVSIPMKRMDHLKDKLERKARVLRLKVERDNVKQWASLREHLTGADRLLLDSIIADTEKLRLFRTRLGVLQGAVQSAPGARYDELPPIQRRELGLEEHEVRTPLQVLFDAMVALVGYELDDVYYQGFVLMVDLLTSTSVAQAALKLESIAFFSRKLSGKHPLAGSLTFLVSILAQIGLGAALVFQTHQESFLQTILDLKDSPLSTKLAAAAIAIIPSITAIEVGTVGHSVVGTILDRIKNATTPHATALGALAEALDVVIKNITKFSETGDIKDLIGRDSSAAWILEANEVMENLNKLRSDFKGKDIRAILRDAQALYDRGLKSKNAQVASKVRELEVKIRNFKEGLSKHRLPPVAMIVRGPPGCGKTVFMERLSTCWKNRLKIDDDIQVMYEYSATTFQSPPSILSILTLNDFFQLKAESPKLKVDPLDLLQKLSDSSPMDMEGASLDLKNFYIQPDFVVVTTNVATYQFANAVGGVSKLDRRYFILEMAWTEAMSNWCALNKVKEYEAYRFGTYEGKVKYPVTYKVGHMDTDTSPSNQTINIKAESLLFETYDLDRVIGFFFTEEKKRAEVFARRFHENIDQKCNCGLKVGSGCPCDAKQGIRLGEPEVDDAPEVEEGEDGEEYVPVNVTRPWRPTKVRYDDQMQYQGATISHAVDEGSREFIADALTRLENAAYCLPGSPTGSFDKATQKLIDKLGLIAPGSFRLDHVLKMDLGVVRPEHVLGGLAGCALLVFLIKRFAEKFDKQGLVHSTVSFPKEVDETRPLPPFHATQAPYLKPNPASNTVTISRSKKGVRISMQAIILSKYWLVLPYHFFLDVENVAAIDEGDVINITYLGQPFDYHYRQEYLCVFDAKRDRAYLYNPCMHSVSAGVFNALPEQFTVPSEPVDLGDFKGLSCYDRHDGCISYNAPTLVGSCGTPLIGTRTGVIYGFHYARFFSPLDPYSHAEPLSKQEARRVFAWGNAKGLVSDVHIHSLPRVLQQKVDEGVLLPGLHPRSDASWYQKDAGEAWPLHNHQVVGHFTSCDKEKFSVHKTTLHARFGGRCKEYTNPHAGKAKLQPDGTYSSAVVTRLNVAKNPPFTWNHAIAMRVIESMVGELDIEQTRPLSDYESLCGSPVDVMINAKDTTKSIGPTARMQGLRKEEAFREIEPGVYEVDKLLQDAIVELEREIREDENLRPCYVKAQGKDEAYPKEKADKGRKRFFYISDWPLNHVCRKYILPLISLLIRQPKKSGFFIAINAASPAWKTLCDWLQELGIDIMDADFSSFDLCHRFILLMYVVYMCMVAEKATYVPDEVKFMRRLMIKRLWYCLEMEGNFFYVLYQLCSGWMDTIIVNCFAVKFMYTYAYFKRSFELKVIPRPPSEVTRIGAVGDDSVVNIHKAIQHILNPALMQVEAALMGYAMTAGDKSAVMKFTELRNIVFLKRGFKIDGKRVWAPLSLDSIYKALAYSTGKFDAAGQRQRDESAANSAVREMFLHGRDMYDELCRELREEFSHARYPTYDELLLEYDMGMFETWRDLKAEGTVMQYQSAITIDKQALHVWTAQRFATPLVEEWLRRSPLGLPCEFVTAYTVAYHAGWDAGCTHFLGGLLSFLLPWWLSLGLKVYVSLSQDVPFMLLAKPGVWLNSHFFRWGCSLGRLTQEALGVNTATYTRVQLINLLTLSPVAEEIIKREVCGLLFPLVEMILFTTVTSWQVRVPALMFHYAVTSLPFPVAVVLHVYWNAMAVHIAGGFIGTKWWEFVHFITYPLQMYQFGVFAILDYYKPSKEGGDVVYQPAQGAVLSCPIPGRGAVKDFPVSELSMQTRAYSHGDQICSTELNSQPQDVGDMTTNATHITMINGDSTTLTGGGAPYDSAMEQGYEAFFGRPRQILEFSTPINTVQLNSIMTLWRALAPVAEMRSQWGLFRGRPKITISYTGNASFNGLVRVFFYPAFSAGYSTYQDYSYPTIGVTDCNHVSTSNLPHIDLDMAQSCTCEMELPYIHNKPYTGWAEDWYVGVRTINAITTASGVTPSTVKITIMVSYHDVALSRIQYQGAVEVQGGVLSKGLALAASLSKWFPITTPYTKMLELGSQAAYSLGYSRAVEPTSAAMVSKRFGALGYMTGEASFGTTLGSDPMQTGDMSGMYAPGENLDSILAISKKWSQLLADWTFAPIGVNPAIIGWENATTVSHTHLGNVAIMFERWSGKLEYRIQFVCSSLIRWRIGIVYVPVGVTTPVSFPTDGSYVTHIVEAAGSTDYFFSVDYIYDQPYQYVQPLGVYSPSVTMGKLVAFSLSDPAGPSATIVYPSLNVWVRAGDDFALSVPSTKHLSTYKQYQSACEKIEVSSLGEKVDSLRMLSKRKCHMANILQSTVNGNKFSMPADGYPGWGTVTYNNGMANQVILTDAYFTFDTYIRQLFFGYKGGSAYTIYSPGDTANWIFGTSEAIVGSSQNFPDRVNAEGRGGALYFPDFNKVNELIVPDRSGYTFKGSVWNQFLNPITGKECLVGFNQDVNATPVERYWVVHEAAADDRTFVHYLGYLRLVKR